MLLITFLTYKAQSVGVIFVESKLDHFVLNAIDIFAHDIDGKSDRIFAPIVKLLKLTFFK
jgi:hypothetical protein